MIISLIAAIGKNNAIGVGGKLPWNLPDDLKRFKEITKGHCVIMGRKTYESIGRLLPERKNIIITRNKEYKIDGAIIVSSIEEALKECGGDNEPFVIGGGEIFKIALPYANKMYLTRVDTKIPADAFFPEWNPDEWKILSKEFHPKDARHEYDFTFIIYKRNV